MANVMELYEKRNKAVADARAFLDSKRGAGDTLSAEDEAVYAKMEADILALGREIDRETRLGAINDELNKPTSQAIVNNPAKPGTVKTGRASDEYHRAFFDALRGRAVSNVLESGTDANGGYLVPTEFETNIVMALDEANVMRGLAKVIRTGTERKIPFAATRSVAKWTQESEEITESGVTFAQKSLDAYKATDMIKVPNELLQDAMIDLPAYISADFARALGAIEEEAFIVGDGVNKPTGLLNATKGADLGVTAAKPTDISADEIISLVYSLKSPYRQNAAFLTNDATVAMLRKLKDMNGAYMWQPSMQAGEPARLFGYALHTSPYVPVVAAGKSVMAFGDFSNYWIADRLTRTIKRLNERYAEFDQTGFLITERVDGKVMLSEGIKLLKMAAA